MKTYKSKFGSGLLIILVIIFALITGTLMLQSAPLKSFFSLIGIFLLILGFFLYLVNSTRYIIDDKILTVKCGFFHNKRYDINKIRSISKTRNLIASPAPSFDRIELTYEKYGLIVISPKDKIDFANELTKINPKIENKLTEKKQK